MKFTEATIIYPHQLYHDHPATHKQSLHILVEEPLMFGDHYYPAKFHKQKLVLHRASMKYYQHEVLGQSRYSTDYWDYIQLQGTKSVFERLADEGISKLHIVDPTDYILQKRIQRYSAEFELEVEWYESPNFVTSVKKIDEYLDSRSGKKDNYHQTNFYRWQRKRLNILINADGSPTGGQWSYDPDNRKKLPKDYQVSEVSLTQPENTKDYIQEAKEYAQKNFPNNPGNLDDFVYAIDRESALQGLDQFLEERFADYGPYQDAITTRSVFVNHAVLTYALNIGLIGPQEIVDKALAYASANEGQIPLNSLEGFVRQVIGWREFMRMLYIKQGSNMRNSNHFNYTRKIPDSFYTGDTGILPIDDTIKKLNQFAYAHHIERLMLLGNFMLLCEFDPSEVYTWFMEMFIDSYDWVMVPNVFGMSQYADGGQMVTKPYVSSSNYVRKMSDYTGNKNKEGSWQEVWDALYWCFIQDHQEVFSINPRMRMMVSLLGKKSEQRLQGYNKLKQDFLEDINR